MKKIIALLILVFAILLFMNRQRLYVRDPLGSVTRNGVQEQGAQVYINFSNDILLENDNPPIYFLLLQHGSRMGAPVRFHCAHWVACLLDADIPTLDVASPPAEVESMTGKTVTFRDEEKHEVVVTLH